MATSLPRKISTTRFVLLIPSGIDTCTVPQTFVGGCRFSSFIVRGKSKSVNLIAFSACHFSTSWIALHLLEMTLHGKNAIGVLAEQLEDLLNAADRSIEWV